MENVNEDGHPEFKWLKKKGVGGKNKEVQFYESFLYDGVEYTLYDNVYMYKEGLQEPYIGKLTKIWERKPNTKKVKVHWFFRPEEILKWLGNNKTLENEILFASGEGHGLTNINSLESIAGPCNVVCISQDHRNPQPSAEELKAADFVFYRTFDVQSCTILDTIDDKVGEVEVKFVFNRGEVRESIPDTKQKNTTCSESQQFLTTIVPNTLQDNPNLLKRSIPPTESDKLNDPPLKKLKPGGKSTPEEKRAEPEVAQDSEKLTGMPLKKSKVDNTNKIQVEVNNLKGVGTSGTNSETGKTAIANKDDKNVSMVPVDKKVENRERNKTPTGSDRLPNQPFKKQNSDVKKPPMVDNKSKHEEKLPADVNDLKDLGTSGTTEDKLNQKNGKISSKVTDDSEGKIVQNSNDGGSAKLPDNKKLGNNGSGSAKLPGNKKLGNSGSGKDLVANPSLANGKSKAELALDPTANIKGSKQEQSSEGKMSGSGNDLVANPSLANGKSKAELALDPTANNKGSKQEQSSEGKIIKKSNNDGSAKLPDNKKLGNSGSGKDLVACSALAKGKSKSGLALDSTANNKESKEEQSSQGKTLKSSKDDGSAKLGNSGSGKDLVANSSLPKEKSKSGLALDSAGNNKESKEEQSHENKRRLTMNKSFKVPASSTDRDKKSAYHEFVCGSKPNDVNDDKSSWFRQLDQFLIEEKLILEVRILPWDERLKNAYDQGTAILLHNVDPDYTSSEIEDIVWHAFNEKCAAKIVQRTALSSPHYGQAIILLNKKEAAQKILVKLDKECLMLSNGRPLVATNCPPISTKKNSKFFGHLALDKFKLQSQRDVEDAVSTSHFSQPNTIVYDMAMDWCLIQWRSKKCWDKLHKQQGLDLKSLESNRVQK